MQETVVLSVGREDPLEKEMATLPVFLCQLQIGTRALPTTEQQRHLPRASTEIEPHAAIAASFNNPWRSSALREALCAPGNLVGQVFR